LPDIGIHGNSHYWCWRRTASISYIDDFKLLMIATLVLIKLLIVFKRPTSGGTNRIGWWPECGLSLRGAISSHVELSDCRFAFKQLPGREREPLGSPLVGFSRGMVFTAPAIDRVERP
jgi:hypothetical protein